jgi:hypothetical protein
LTLPLQAVSDPASDQNFRTISRQLPLQPQQLSDAAKDLFPQLVTGGAHKINFGTTTVTFPGAENASKNKEVEHGLGTTPAAILVTCEGTTSGGSGGNFAEAVTKSSTKITIRAVNPFVKPALNETLTVNWFAIG